MESKTAVDPRRVEAVVRAAAAGAFAEAADREFTTFRCGSLLPRDLEGAPPAVREGFREAVRTRLAATLAAAWPGCRLDTAQADLVVDADPDRLGAAVQVAPVYVAGRYRKLARGLSQTVFRCRTCHGGLRRAVMLRGPCAACAGTGRFVAEAVEDFVRPAIERAVGGAPSSFHGAGREDVDVRMLGRGRPFVVSVERPRRRAPLLSEVPAAVAAASGGRVEVADLEVVGRAGLAAITTGHGVKTYRAVVEPASAADLPGDAAARLLPLVGVELAQRTPRRVDDRRADLVRHRRVLSLTVEDAGARRMSVALRTDPGTYVKEVVSGDGGRTSPSIAHLLGVPCVCAELDVLDVSGVLDVPGPATS